jgi:U3 small nucleolar RNA-associated protein 6
MADKVDNILEKMAPELKYYEKAQIFSPEEVKRILKERREHEYQIHAPSSELSEFLSAIVYEKKLEKLFLTRKMTTGKVKKSHMLDFSIRRRVMHVYDRLLRKFKGDVYLWKDYLHYLLTSNSLNKFDSVITNCLHLFPNVLEFWLISVYTELDL